MEGEFADLDIKDFRAVFISTDQGEIKIEEKNNKVYLTLDGLTIKPFDEKTVVITDG